MAAPRFIVRRVETQYKTERREAMSQYTIRPARGDGINADELTHELRKLFEANPTREFMVAVQIPGVGWRNAAQFYSAGARDIRLAPLVTSYSGLTVEGDGDPLERVTSALLISRPIFRPAGGCSDDGAGAGKNDCLWRAVASGYNGLSPDKLMTDELLRRNVGAPPAPALIPATPAIFAKLEGCMPGVALLVEGDVQWSSGRQAPRSLRLRIERQHYTRCCQPSRNATHRTVTAKREGLPVRLAQVAAPAEGEVTIHAADGSSQVITIEEYEDMRRRPREAPFLIVRPLLGASVETPEQRANFWAQRHEAREALLANHGLDLDHFATMKDYALELWRLRSAMVPDPAEIRAGSLEEAAIDQAFRGGLAWAEKGWEGPAVGLDVRSMYPRIMSSRVELPMTEGTATRLDSLGEVVGVGLYRARIEVPAAMRALWRGEAAAAWYTHDDVKIARLLGGSVTLAADGEANAILYASGRINGFAAFGKYRDEEKSGSYDRRDVKNQHGFVPRLYELKRSGSPAVAAYAKTALNILWGALGERNRRVMWFAADDASVVVPDHIEQISSTERGAGVAPKLRMKVRDTGAREFRHNFARWVPFITARARLTVAEMLLPHVGKLRRIHTDGFVLEGDIPADLEAKIGDELGDLKVEHRGHCKVFNTNKVQWREDVGFPAYLYSSLGGEGHVRCEGGGLAV